MNNTTSLIAATLLFWLSCSPKIEAAIMLDFATTVVDCNFPGFTTGQTLNVQVATLGNPVAVTNPQGPSGIAWFSSDGNFITSISLSGSPSGYIGAQSSSLEADASDIGFFRLFLREGNIDGVRVGDFTITIQDVASALTAVPGTTLDNVFTFGTTSTPFATIANGNGLVIRGRSPVIFLTADVNSITVTNLDVAGVPEPSSIALLSLITIGVAVKSRYIWRIGK